MDALFLKILNMSMTALYVIIAVIIIRFIIRRAPKKFSYALWSAVAFRLLCPVSFESVFSLFNLRIFSVTNTPAALGSALEYIPQNITSSASPKIYSGIAALNSALDIPLPQTVADTAKGISPMQMTLSVLCAVWLIGFVAMMIYGIYAYMRIRLKMRCAVLLCDNVFQSDEVSTPFILGFIRPRIYLPFSLDGERLKYVLSHERCHIKRLDHIIKPLSFVLLSIHWFNPLVWISFYLMSRDMEMSCDEKVLSEAENIRCEYSDTLLSFAKVAQFPSPSPLAFGESSVKSRIKNALKWKRPTLIKTLAVSILSIAVIVGCAANPNHAEKPLEAVGEYEGNTLGGEFLKSGKSAYDIGVSQYGRPIFKDADAAFEQALEDYADGFEYIADSFGLPSITKYNYGLYKTYGWQAASENEDIYSQCRAITQFFDIYENSFDRTYPPVSSASVYTGGAFIAQHIALSFQPQNGRFYESISLDNKHLEVISSEGTVIYQGDSYTEKSYTLSEFADYLNELPFAYLRADGSASSVEELLSGIDAQTVTSLSYYQPSEPDIHVFTVYLFGSQPLWFADHAFRIYQLLPYGSTVSDIGGADGPIAEETVAEQTLTDEELLDRAIRGAILQHHTAQEPDPDGLFKCVSYVIIEEHRICGVPKETGGVAKDILTLKLLAMHCSFGRSVDELILNDKAFYPLELTFEVIDGVYTDPHFRIPEPGEQFFNEKIISTEYEAVCYADCQNQAYITYGIDAKAEK